MTEEQSVLSRDYDHWHAHRLSEEGHDVHDESRFACWHQMVIPRLGDLTGLQVAEIGCGRGNFAIYLAKRGASVTAMDFSAAAIEIAKERSATEQVNVNWLVGDAANIPLESQRFDLVISCEVPRLSSNCPRGQNLGHPHIGLLLFANSAPAQPLAGRPRLSWA